ncbi:ATP-binding protein [Phytohabitans suffuscus]|uniref:ATP-binding protein n=1 Tax=Phytohabitans suffuscus TaxID=624315 RepID=UPI0022B2A37C|nr:ATP-binding protein [Phytohabitans suffuscus]
MLAEEAAGRDAANLRTRRQRATFPTGKTFHVWNEEASSIPIPTQTALRSLEWIARRENLCVCGPSGTGKSHFTEALGQAAVDAGMTVAWFTIEDLGTIVRRRRVDDSVTKAMQRLTRTDLIIVDDIGLPPVSTDAAEGFYRLIDAAYERRSLAVSSNLHPAGFNEIMPKTLATATRRPAPAPRPHRRHPGRQPPPLRGHHPARSRRPHLTTTSNHLVGRNPVRWGEIMSASGDHDLPPLAISNCPLTLDAHLQITVRTQGGTTCHREARRQKPIRHMHYAQSM